MNALRVYLRAFTVFSAPVRSFLFGTFVLGLSGSVNWLVLNFYLEAQGHDQRFIGLVNSLPAATVLLLGVPLGLWGDRLDRRVAIRAGAILVVIAALGVASAPWAWLTASAVALAGVGNLLLQGGSAPYLAENSTAGERTHLFSAQAALSFGTGLFGSLIGGALPSLLALASGGKPSDVTPLRGTLLVGASVGAVGLLPLLRLRPQGAPGNAPTPNRFSHAWSPLFLKLLAPHAAIGLGAGMIMPFLNQYIHRKFGVSYGTIGAVFGASSLATALAILAQPWLAERYGKVRAVLIVQAASIPFLLLLGYVPWFPAAAAALFVRGALMNMAVPVFIAFCMEEVPAGSRAFFMSLHLMAWNGAWAVGSNFSGQLQTALGFAPAFHILFGAMTSLYVLAIVLFGRWFAAVPRPAVECG